MLHKIAESHLSMVDQDMEERVKQQDSVWSNTAGIKKYRFWGPIEGVGVEYRLDHDQGLGEVFY